MTPLVVAGGAQPFVFRLDPALNQAEAGRYQLRVPADTFVLAGNYEAHALWTWTRTVLEVVGACHPTDPASHWRRLCGPCRPPAVWILEVTTLYRMRAGTARACTAHAQRRRRAFQVDAGTAGQVFSDLHDERARHDGPAGASPPNQ